MVHCVYYIILYIYYRNRTLSTTKVKKHRQRTLYEQSDL